ncbi:DUF4065 domain-containing protein [Enterococcus faecalis]|uniref:Panacea domain-containing protein n=1 Tax=Enterococcus faecalis TaxID=1351 RepID=UPI0013704F35|nr:type II toxin-antitoxin system antitoxin SocA domain-containing protein [Enterococcus faecalis]NAA43299.1 DUF4065 domain-containing protein [Enterococcus faecalis]NAA62120.1 DUF4065 domain-containing protein [Enterococcus faecalis]NAB65966.1 DUF4065 domain-containing protein [Enterococcus faecalis]NAB86219.1 DUF4065 domain-containing protein [Enterococcus faecalis]NAB88981.1 DUF4065 domain-containing protein [Enterococcus faecalis]
MAKAIDAANYIIEECNKKGFSINNLKLQKLLYYSEVESLTTRNTSLFQEDIEKWKLGPVVPVVYHEFKHYGASNIYETQPVLVFDAKSNDVWDFKFEDFKIDSLTTQERECIDTIIERSGDKDPFDLVEQTHQEDLWKVDEVRIANGEKHLKYDRFEMKRFFSQED